MALLNDKEISKLAELDIFQPYVGEKRRKLDNGTKAISYGLSQAGYDIRLSPKQFLVFTDDGLYRHDFMLDPKLADPTVPYEATLVHYEGSSYFELSPFSFALGTSLELISMPNDVMGICQGKSTYGRIGLVANILPIEPGWSGYLTMCLVNPTPFPMRVYANEGICQVLLFRLDGDVEQSYTGQYQNQGQEVTLSKVG
jgi:dCTP deaminase